MVSSMIVTRWLRPWRIAAVALAVASVFLMQADRAHAAVGAVVTVNNPTTATAADLSIAVLLDTDLGIGDSAEKSGAAVITGGNMTYSSLRFRHRFGVLDSRGPDSCVRAARSIAPARYC